MSQILYRPFHKVLIANRGEIAIRIMKACHELGLQTVAVYSDADREACHVQYADQAVWIGAAPSTESYLNQTHILQAAAQTGADAIHPGYGFLAENAEFAKACIDAGFVWIGPHANVIKQMGSKKAAREWTQTLDIPVIPGWQGAGDIDVWLQAAEEIGYPLLIKASAGGGGKGMRRVENPQQLPPALELAQSEALQSFGDSQVYLEAYLDQVRHIEVQIIGDSQGHILHAFERECSLQRRFQKIIEECPSPVLSSDLRASITQDAVKLAQSLNYCGLATVEFVFDAVKQAYYFLEVNTRLQVEHPVTELVTGLDLVHWQLHVAAGQPLTLQQADIQLKGHAIEARICAEDPGHDFRPAVGKIEGYFMPDHVRVDSGFKEHSVIPMDYDSMLAKMIVWGDNRQLASQKMQRALSQAYIWGPQTNLALLKSLVSHTAFKQADFYTHWIQDHLPELLPAELSLSQQAELMIAACLWQIHQTQSTRQTWAAVPAGWRNQGNLIQTQKYQLGSQELKLDYQRNLSDKSEQSWLFHFAEQAFAVRLLAQDQQQIRLEINGVQKNYQILFQDAVCWLHHIELGSHQLQVLPRFPEKQSQQNKNDYQAAIPAKVVQILVQVGQIIEVGQSLIVLESMKMQSTIAAAEAGQIKEILVSEQEQVAAGTTLLILDPLPVDA